MKQLTVKEIDDELSSRLLRLAEREGTTLNEAVLKTLRKGTGMEGGEGTTNTIGSSLDDLFGAWSAEEAAAFNEALAVFEAVDESA